MREFYDEPRSESVSERYNEDNCCDEPRSESVRAIRKITSTTT